LAHARELSSDDRGELRALAAQARAFRGWRALAETAIRGAEQSGLADTAALERRRNVFLGRFDAANNAYQHRLSVNRSREESATALLPVWVLVGDFALFGLAGGLLVLRSRRARARRERYLESQRRFIEGMQFARDEREAQGLLVHHLERRAHGSVVLLNRNNSADRLESAQQLPAESALNAVLPAVDPRSCLAVRLNRRYERD